MAIGVALIGVLGAAANSKINSNRSNSPQNLDKDQRTTSIDELFSASFLESLSTEDRTALESQVATGLTQTTKGTAESDLALQRILSGERSPDAEAAIQARITQVLESGSPAIAGVTNRAGGFDSTVSAQLQNDLVTQAANAGAQLDLQQQNTDIQAVLQAAQLAQESRQTQQQESATDTDITERTDTVVETDKTDQSTSIGDSLTDIGGSNTQINLLNNPLQQLLAMQLAEAGETGVGIPSTGDPSGGIGGNTAVPSAPTSPPPTVGGAVGNTPAIVGGGGFSGNSPTRPTPTRLPSTGTGSSAISDFFLEDLINSNVLAV